MPFSEVLSSWYREYEFVTAVYLLEPWERRIVNVVMAGLGVFAIYSTFAYLPHYATSFAGFLASSISA